MEANEVKYDVRSAHVSDGADGAYDSWVSLGLRKDCEIQFAKLNGIRVHLVTSDLRKDERGYYWDARLLNSDERVEAIIQRLLAQPK